MTNAATTPSGQPLGISHKPSATEAMFDRLKAENKPAFIGYLPYGFPNPDISLDALRTMIEHGVDAVEIGLPYSTGKASTACSRRSRRWPTPAACHSS